MSGQGPTYQADVRFRVEGYDEVARHWKPSNESRRARQQPPLNHPQITSMLDPSVWRPSVPKEQHDRAEIFVINFVIIRPGKAPPQQNQNDNGFNEQLSTIPNATPQLISHNVNVEATDGKFQRTLLPTKPNVAEVKNRLTAIYADKANDSTSSSSTSQTVTSALSISTPAVTTQTTSSSSIVSQSSTTQRTQHRATTTPNFPACEPCGDSLKFQEQPTPILYSESANSNKTRLVEELPPMDNKLVAPISARISSASTGQTKK
ncbi:unnamed protein product, partial [Mesorhabditis belari]|uniref:Uncharacterized protein n=1 Tax=Mesorhabditis belari TaxID=2138241 RepID=A0AAF3FMM8_9BILA